MKSISFYEYICLIILIVGGINWGLLGLFNVDIISGIFGSLLGRLIYIVIGAAAGYLIYQIYVQRFKKTV